LEGGKMMKFVKMMLLILFAFSLIGFGACEKSGTTDPNGDNPANPANNSLTVTISGDFALNFIASLSSSVISNEDMGLSGSVTIGTVTYSITIIIYSTPGTGTFQFADFDTPNNELAGKAQGNIGVADTQGSVQAYWIDSGSITVSEMSTRVKGTFNFVASEGTTGGGTITGTGGQFDLLRINI
jgi:hypothetical protein